MRGAHLVFVLFAAACAATACTPNVSPDSYSVGSVGQINRAIRGEIVSARDVQISGTQSGTGVLAGAAGGGIAGSAIGGGVRANALGAVGGAIVGGIAGMALEEAATGQTGREYVVSTENGALITIVQGDEPAFETGQKIIVLYGTRSRIIADSSTK